MSQQATRRRGQARTLAQRGLRANDASGEHARERRVVFPGRVGVDVDIEEGFGGLVEVELPERSERERRGGQEHESQFLRRRTR